MNSLILCLHVISICSLTLFALRFGKEMMAAWLSLLAVVMNLFVLKQINVFGLNVTASDAIGVGYLLGLNLIQEFFGRSFARKCIWISLFISCAFLLISLLHLLYIPNSFDSAHPHFIFLLSPMPRIILASLATFVIVQLLDVDFFSFLQTKAAGKYLTLRTTIALLFSQTIDTLLFSFLGLYATVESIMDVVCFSLAIKFVVILLSTPFVTLCKKIIGDKRAAI